MKQRVQPEPSLSGSERRRLREEAELRMFDLFMQRRRSAPQLRLVPAPQEDNG